jgi:hypothetical protein
LAITAFAIATQMITAATEITVHLLEIQPVRPGSVEKVSYSIKFQQAMDAGSLEENVSSCLP